MAVFISSRFQRCFVYLDPDYTGADTKGYPRLRAAFSPSVTHCDVYLAYHGDTLDSP
jgi:hypothetical protein